MINEQKLRRRIQELSRRHVRGGRRLVYRVFRQEGWIVNYKRVQQIWLEHAVYSPFRAGSSEHLPLEVNGSLYELSIHITSGLPTSILPDDGWEDTQVPQCD